MARPRITDDLGIGGLFFFYGFPIAAFFPFLAVYLQDHHGLSTSEIGFVLSAAAVARMLANPVWGHLADAKIGRMLALQIGLVGATIAGLSLNLVDGLAAIASVMFVNAAFMVAHGPNVDAIALEHLGDDRMAEYGRVRGWESLAYAGGCLAFGAFLQAAGVGWAMSIYAVSLVLVLGWTVLIPRDRPRGGDHAHGRMGTVGAVFREAPRFWGFLVAVLLVWIGFNAAWNFIGPRIEGEGGGAMLIGLGTALGGLAEVPVMRSSSRLQPRFGLRKLYVAGCLVYGTLFLLWGTVSDPTALAMLTVLEGVGFSLLFTTGVVVVGRLLPSTLYSTGNAVAQMTAFGIGPIIGAGVGGVMYQHLGAPVMYASAAALAASASIVAWFALAVPSLAAPAAPPPAEPLAFPSEPHG
jgi:MFS transporter, PPP family, 3-phenylpropionic acid transporter